MGTGEERGGTRDEPPNGQTLLFYGLTHTLNCNYWFSYPFLVTSRAHFAHCVHFGQIDLLRGEKDQVLPADTHITLVCP